MLVRRRNRPCRGVLGAWLACLLWCGPLLAKEALPRSERAASGLYHPDPAFTSIEPRLQAEAGRLLVAAAPVSGAVLMLHAPTGRVIAWQEYRRDRRRGPSLVTNAIAPAASVFKIVTAATLLERAELDPRERVCFVGGEHAITRQHLEPPAEARPSCMLFGQALGFSVNAVFAQLATQRLARRDLVEIGDLLGFNKPLPFELPARVGELEVPYGDLAFARTAIGAQGSSLSVLGAARLVYVVAQNGLEPRMTLRVSQELTPTTQPLRLLSLATAARLRRMLEVTVHSGTSLSAFSDEHGASYLGDIRVAGKTGTLQREQSGPTTSWFTGFAPSRQPEVVVSVLLQNGRIWRRKANMVARDLLRAYFSDRRGVTPPA